VAVAWRRAGEGLRDGSDCRRG